MKRVFAAIVSLAAIWTCADAQVTAEKMQELRERHPRIYECSPNLNATQTMDPAGAIHISQVCPAGTWHKPLSRAEFVQWTAGRGVRFGNQISILQSDASTAIASQWSRMDQSQRKGYYCSKFDSYFAVPIKTDVDQMDMAKVHREYDASGCKE